MCRSVALGTLASNNGMHPTADTLPLMFLHRPVAAGDAGRYAATPLIAMQSV
jgi:predicted FMN-binding regulatory protein PaiB